MTVPGADSRETAAALLEAARAGDRARFTQCLGALAKEIEAHVRAVAARNARLLARVPALSPDDVVQEVFQRLLRSPPSGEADNPIAMVLAWAGTTTMRFLLDEAARPSARRREFARADDAHEETSTTSPLETGPEPLRVPDAARRVEARSEIANVRRILAERYPRGLQLLDAELAHPDESDAVLADELRTSAANIQQIRHRRLRVLADFESGRKGDDRP